MAHQPILASEFDPKKLTFSAPQKNRLGGKMVFVSSGPGGRSVVIQCPPMHAPFGATAFVGAMGGGGGGGGAQAGGGMGGEDVPQSFSLDLSFKDQAAFMDKMREMDDALLDVAVERSVDWFGKSQSKEILAEFMRRVVREPSDVTKYSPTLRCKVQCDRAGKPQCQTFDEAGNRVDFTEVTKGCTLRVIVELSSVWFINRTNFGVTLKVQQVQIVDRPPGIGNTFAFRTDDDTDNNTNNAPLS